MLLVVLLVPHGKCVSSTFQKCSGFVTHVVWDCQPCQECPGLPLGAADVTTAVTDSISLLIGPQGLLQSKGFAVVIGYSLM